MTRDQALRWGRGDSTRLSVTQVPGAVLQLVDERLGGRVCVDCRALGLTPPADEPIELDHQQPLARGGDNHHLNLTWRCRSHNRVKGARAPGGKPLRPRWERRRR